MSLSRDRSAVLYRELCDVIPGGVNSPVRAFKGLGMTPMVAERGKGDTVWDVDGYPYIDYCCSWGALLHGHSHPTIVAAAYAQMERGSSFGITTEAELKLACAIRAEMPSMEKVRFVSTGTEATMSAVRLARGYTGRSLIIKYSGHYHGHADGFLVQAGSGVFGNTPTSSSAGIPDSFIQHTVCLPYNDLEASRRFLREHGQEVAAVILEPIAGNMGVVPADCAFMEMLREETIAAGALLIFDEVMTGFRVARGGAQALYKIDPDLTCLAKIIGGGFPVAAFGGKRVIMEQLAPLGSVYQAGTLSGNPVAMAAGSAALALLNGADFYEMLQKKTDRLLNPLRAHIAERQLPIAIQAVGSMFTIFFGAFSVHSMEEARFLDLSLFSRFFHFLFERGVYPPPLQYEAWFISSAHTEEHLDFTRDAILSFFQSLPDSLRNSCGRDSS